ncbi:hypothetical protein COCC4DRAFT_128626 [Bipolaris maydis ATCC 48331]|uniref:SH3 domain-containing protein n=2 Tax=Cochliobolus heterostrophus TaxID=5016 RepID=N4XRB6_COCH4|nr:uncharacterized protein COCC4DRAFT_128626 [Bipolaris maydis ATCC 48331]KAJ5027439.1 hypothetical protein J3E73DRAFT_231387 [Bipolaris maydis]ENI08881.1 hypothetical protein COCC4DRAFT_128626 [Bipolaris maydis ATCC 48331]KAJ5058776.1 SH3 domain-containing protein [Bipolaris maydis]KAJ6270662.1 hypothetical protein PSV08DRAFT_223199 [Bipolaris maydis]KAJ6278011.1 hypothetical protein J3E71DRAFT_394034 [Bipolaris maydis]
MAQSCVSLAGSTACPAFASASINTNLTGNFPFLKFVSNTQSFDQGLRNYIATGYAQQQYEDILGCSKVNLTSTTNLYARFTTTVLCNAIVQSSKQSCGLSDQAATPLCADACAEFAISEQVIISSPELCGTPGNNAVPQIRSDFARCSNPADALSTTCIEAVKNEPTECGFQNNLEGLCLFCAGSTTNSTDTCCVNANVDARCQNVDLPTTISMPPVFPTSTSSASPTSTAGGASGGHNSKQGLSGGAIAGIVIGSLIGAALVIAAVIFCCMQRRRQKYSQAGSVFNTPSPSRHHSSKGNPVPPMAFGGDANHAATILPGARVQRMSALEDATSSANNSDRGGRLTAYGGSQLGAYDSPESIRGALAAGLPKRQGSLSSHSALGMHSSPLSGSDQSRSLSSPDGLTSQSEQLQFFKDYYSQDDIHPNDTVATLWAYQPRAGDEFELERGDMLKVVGIWDDGWATGVRISETAEQWEARKAEQRDSGVSSASGRMPLEDSEIKAFPLVCVCLPQHWRKTIEGDSAIIGGHRSRGDRGPSSP